MYLGYYPAEEPTGFDFLDIEEELFNFGPKIIPIHLPQSLDMPMLDLPYVKLKLAAGIITKDEAYSRLRSWTHIRNEQSFIREMNAWRSKASAEERQSFNRIYRPEDPALFAKVMRETNCSDITRTVHTDVALELGNLFSAAMREWGLKDHDLKMPSFDVKLKNDTLVQKYYSWWRTYEWFYDSLRNHCSMGFKNCLTLRSSDHSFCGNDKYIYVYSKKLDCSIVMTITSYLGILDMMRVRFNTRVCTYFIGHSDEFRNIVEEQYKWQEECITRYGNPGFELAKSTEALWKCWISRISGGSYSRPDSYDRMIEKIQEKERKLCDDNFPEDNMAIKFCHITMQVLNVEEAVELFGLTKSISHPVINPEIGGASSRDYAQAPTRAFIDAERTCQRVFKHLMLINFIEKNSRWPPITFTGRHEHTKLYQLYKKNVLHITDGCYPLPEWDKAEIGKIFDINTHQDYLPLLKDKSCAPPLSKLKDYYFNRQSDKAMRRILNVMLDSNDTNTEQLLVDFMNNKLSRDEYNILLFPKECEFKLAARMFCMLTFRMRLIFSIIQENVKDGVFSLLPYQSMTMDRTELNKKLLKMTKESAKHETLLIEVDLTRWNLCFRDTFISGFGKIMDSLYGVNNLFGRSHQVFSSSLVSVFVPDQKIPQLEETLHTGLDSDTQWQNHDGGFEGIDQATWTAATICMIYLALWKENCTFQLLGQGDNQTLAITRPRSDPEPLAQFADRIMRNIERVCDDVNHIAKPEEFVDSTSTLTYSKNFYVNGAMIPMTLKYAMKIGPFTASDVPTLTDAYGSIYSAAVGVAQTSLHPMRVWTFAHFQAQLLTERLKLSGAWLGDVGKQAYEQINAPNIQVLMSSIPSILGGLPVTSPSNFFCRNEPDPLTAEIAWLRLFARVSPIHRKYLSWLLTDEPYHKEITDYSKLIMDPYSLPFIQPATPQSLIDSLNLSTVQAKTRNSDIKEALQHNNEGYLNLFIKALSELRPMYPALAHDLYKLSLSGKVDELKGMFTTTRTMINSYTDQLRLSTRITKTAMRLFTQTIVRYDMCANCPEGIPARHISSYDIANELRQKWKLSSPIEGMSTSHPLDYDLTTDPRKTSGVQMYVDTDNPLEFLFFRGKQQPYLGAKTYERRIAKTYEVVKTPEIAQLQKLVLLASATSYDQNAQHLIDSVLATRTPYTLEQLKTVFPTTIGGIVAHRYEMMNREGEMGPIGQVTPYTHIKFSSDNIPNLSGSKQDFPVAFQQYYSYLSAAAVLDANQLKLSRYYLLTLNVDNLKTLESSRVTLDPSVCVPSPVRLPHNKLITVNSIHTTVMNEFNLDLGYLKKSRTVSYSEVLDNAEYRRSALMVSLIALSIRDKRLFNLDDNSTLDEVTGSSIDLAAFRGLGAPAIIDATVDASVCLCMYRFTMDQALDFDKKSMHRTIVLFTHKVFNLWCKMLAKTPEYIHVLIRRGMWKASAGADGLDTGLNFLRRYLVNTVTARLYNRESIDRISEFYIAFTRCREISRRDAYLHNISSMIWQSYSQQYETGISSDTLYRIKRLRENFRTVYSPGVDRDFEVLNLTDRLVWAYYNNQIDIPYSYVSQLLKLARFGCCIVDLSPEEYIRLCRQCVPPAAPLKMQLAEDLTLMRPTSTGHPVQLKFLTPTRQIRKIPKTSFTGDTQLPSNLPLLDKTDRYRERTFKRRMFRHYGITSTAIYNWAGQLSCIRDHDVVLVWGTGAGGLQKALWDFGKPSVGIDLNTAVPPAMRGNLAWKPVELAPIPEIVISPLTHTTSGDLFDPQVVELAIEMHNPTILIVDIERGKHRYGFEVISALIQSGFVGRILVKYYLTHCEAEQMTSAIQMLKCKNILVHHVEGELNPDEIGIWTFGFTLPPNVAISRVISQQFSLEYSHTQDDLKLELINLLPDHRVEIVKNVFSAPKVFYHCRSLTEIEEFIEGYLSDFDNLPSSQRLYSRKRMLLFGYVLKWARCVPNIVYSTAVQLAWNSLVSLERKDAGFVFKSINGVIEHDLTKWKHDLLKLIETLGPRLIEKPTTSFRSRR